VFRRRWRHRGYVYYQFCWVLDRWHGGISSAHRYVWEPRVLRGGPLLLAEPRVDRASLCRYSRWDFRWIERASSWRRQLGCIACAGCLVRNLAPPSDTKRRCDRGDTTMLPTRRTIVGLVAGYSLVPKGRAISDEGGADSRDQA
jgi:hypothetical protein